MSTQEAIEVAYEVLAVAPFTLPFEQMDELRWLVLGFCDIKWDPRMLKGAEFEEELRADVTCQDGEVRTLKGTPDVLMFDPPDGLVIVDAKSGRGRPKGPRLEPAAGEVVEDRKYLSDLFQGDTYSYLGMRKYPSVQRVTFRELHLRSGQIRQGTLARDDLEHVERKLGIVMMNLARAVSEGEESPLWEPRPGSHCARQCPVVRSCPIPFEQRGDGSIGDADDARLGARRLAVLEGERKALIGGLKAHLEDPSNPMPEANEDQVVGWKPPLGRGRRFGLWSKADLVDGENEERAA
jgi:hypothetical protein